jgi:UDP-3-O-[3-hydroxymyristoyl] glucosamine N-acyltransferase
MKLQDIARALSAPIIGDDSLLVERIVHPADARGPMDLAVAISDDSFAALNGCRAEAVVISAKSQPPGDFKAVIVADKQRPALAILTRLFDTGPAQSGGIHASAVIAPDAVLEQGVSVGAFVAIGPRVHVGANTMILPHVTIGADVSIGRDAVIHSGVRIGDRSELGDRVTVRANSVVGSDGFGYVSSRQENGAGAAIPQRIHSLGNVVVGDDVEIGAGTTIDRATMAATRIGRGTKIDNQVHIGHNVSIGEACLICAKTGISGSVRVDDGVLIGGAVGIADHVTIGSGATVAAASAVASNVPAGVVVSGTPALRHERTLEHLVYAGRQKALHTKVAALQSRIDELEKLTRRSEP